MQEYWQIISKRHQEKLKTVAKANGVNLETAMCDLVKYLKNDASSLGKPKYIADFITAQQIETLIDFITN